MIPSRGVRRRTLVPRSVALLAPILMAVLFPGVARAAVDIRLSGTDVVLHERASDPMVVTSYGLVERGRSMPYLREYGKNRFSPMPAHWRVSVSPGGSLALESAAFLDQSGCEWFDLVSRRLGTVRAIRTICQPYNGGIFNWSRDGKQAVQLVFKVRKNISTTTGFLIIDAVSATSRYVPLKKAWRHAHFAWTPNGKYVVEYDPTDIKRGIRFLRPDGKLHRAMKRAGTLAGGENAFSPSGDRFATWCTADRAADICLWDSASSKPKGELWGGAFDLYGWWDERHLIVLQRSGKGYQSVLIDLSGRRVRVLADISSSAYKEDEVQLNYSRN
ncbi:hypothetical protein Misp02_70950 [Microtetraspora sp. NBRC 16547]|nr:hypothetical protein Misp02_70950 [Microtetraspora sp. NBRC 16547]